MLAWLSSTKLWLIGAALAVALFGFVLWRAFAKGEQAAQAEAAIAGLNKAIEANNARRNAEANPVDPARDRYNRDNF
ncbi:MAG TPA: hypothetical protein VIY48_16710 [Candidatus Paceibacterota bacterium]